MALSEKSCILFHAFQDFPEGGIDKVRCAKCGYVCNRSWQTEFYAQSYHTGHPNPDLLELPSNPNEETSGKNRLATRK